MATLDTRVKIKAAAVKESDARTRTAAAVAAPSTSLAITTSTSRTGDLVVHTGHTIHSLGDPGHWGMGRVQRGIALHGRWAAH
ncbi:uncharacterized protein BP5553_08914 [Venustampulla echinocandica]|uniref:Uncharacterized protein n=1 Tax=Venustampulla echinocandica TaxID=2656787 RepID=A0A370TDA5_9HELO|nr:uncharacterized protein BP5553_08914 [Venustampulla echinocandica]RDL32458.1 hypothetical protein BP5553_08914 [Venustampulla echinocandica]